MKSRNNTSIAPALQIPQAVFEAHQAPYMDSESLVSFAKCSFFSYGLARSVLEQKGIRKLFGYILNGDAAKVKKTLDANPRLALVKWQAKEEKIMTNKAGQCIQIAGKTAYQVALGEEDTDFAAMLKACIVKMTNEEEANAQFYAQFPEGWKKEEEKRWAPIFVQLDTLTQAIRHANPADIVSSGDPEYKLTLRKGSAVASALSQFRLLLDAALNETIITGRHFNPDLLLRALQIYDNHFQDYFGNDQHSARALLFWQRTIGYIQRFLPANYVQAFCDGLDNTRSKLLLGKPQGRSFLFHVYHPKTVFSFWTLGTSPWVFTDFYPLVNSRLGFDFAIYCCKFDRWDNGGAKASSFHNAGPPLPGYSYRPLYLLRELSSLIAIKGRIRAELTQHQEYRWEAV